MTPVSTASSARPPLDRTVQAALLAATPNGQVDTTQGSFIWIPAGPVAADADLASMAGASNEAFRIVRRSVMIGSQQEGGLRH